MKFDKDAIFHKCPNGNRTRPYPTYCCSMCMGKGRDFNAFRYVLKLEEKIKSIEQESIEMKMLE